jgi:hypothetical protein
MSAHNRKLQVLTLDIGGNEFQIQCRVAELQNNTDDGTFFPTYDPVDGGFIEAAEDSYALNLEFYADWRSDGVSDYLWSQDGTTVSFQLDHHEDIPAEHVRWVGEVLIKAPNVGGEVRTTEITSTVLQCAGKPTFSRP